MTGLKEKVKKIKAFLSYDIWKIEPEAFSKGRFFLLRLAQLISLAFRDFFADNCMLRASALAYATLLSIVPLLALMFSMLKGFGVQNVLEPIILENIGLGSEEIVTSIIQYINNTNFGRLGTVGLVFLILTVLALLTNIEKSFNHIWGVGETRSLFRRFADYFSIVAIGPVFLLAAVSMTTTLESRALVQRLLEMAFVGEIILFIFQIGPFLFMWAAFIALYIFMPNTKVNFRAALVGGVFGGTLWQINQWGYVNFQIGVGRYNAIYGTMSALPIFIVWLYVSWLIVLLGLEVAYATQNLRTVRLKMRGESVNSASRELAALAVLLTTAKAFYRGEKPQTRESISVELGFPACLARNIFPDLVRMGFLSEVYAGAEEEPAYQPARAPQSLEICGVLQALKEDGVTFNKLRKTAEREVIQEIETKIKEAGCQALNGVTLHDLVLRVTQKEERGKTFAPQDVKK
jgi:membrane protein